MQKKIIALAIAGLSGVAFAQSNVTLYGQVDQFLGNFNASGSSSARQAGLFDGGLGQSRIGFKGAENMGNGLTAVFQLEYGLKTDDNNAIGVSATGGTNQARQQLLGVAGNFGTIAGGRLQTAGYDWAIKYSTLGGTAFDTLANVTGKTSGLSTTLAGSSARNSFLLVGQSRANNAVAYISPNLSGVTLKANYSFLNEGGNDRMRGGAYLLAADYDNGPLSVGAVYSSANVNAAMTDGASAASMRLNELGLGASYNFGPASVQAAYQQAQITSASLKIDRAFNVGVKVPVSAAGTVALAYGRSFDGDNAGRFANASLAYLHGLSKRTTVYAGYTYFKNGTDGVNVGVGGATPTDNKGTVNGLALGVQHKF